MKHDVPKDFRASVCSFCHFVDHLTFRCWTDRPRNSGATLEARSAIEEDMTEGTLYDYLGSRQRRTRYATQKTSDSD